MDGPRVDTYGGMVAGRSSALESPSFLITELLFNKYEPGEIVGREELKEAALAHLYDRGKISVKRTKFPSPHPRSSKVVHYPESFPTESVMFIVPLVRSGQLSVKKAEAAEHAWNIFGYALSQTIGHDHAVGVVGGEEEEVDVEVEDVDVDDELVLESLEAKADPAQPGVVGALPIPPALLLSWAFKLLGLFLGK